MARLSSDNALILLKLLMRSEMLSSRNVTTRNAPGQREEQSMRERLSQASSSGTSQAETSTGFGMVEAKKLELMGNHGLDTVSDVKLEDRIGNTKPG